MDPDGDISDAFDDEALQNSIAAGQQGPWGTDEEQFVDPKLQELAKQLKEPPKLDYKARRLEEMQKRAMSRGAQPKKKDGGKDSTEETAADDADWGDGLSWTEDGTGQAGEATSMEPAATSAEDSTAASESDAETESTAPLLVRNKSRRKALSPDVPELGLIGTYAPTLIAAALVFAAATAVHGLLDSWRLELAYRAGGAILVTATLWRGLQSDRMRAMAIGAIVYSLAFAPSPRFGAPETAAPLLLGLMIVVAGSGLIGLQKDEFGAHRL